MFEAPISLRAESSTSTGPSGPENSSASRAPRRLAKYLAALLIIGALIGAVYAGFVATHTFNYPGTSSPVTNKSVSVNFQANEVSTALATCVVQPCFSVNPPAGPVTVMASSTALTGTGVNITFIYVVPLSSSCSPTQPSPAGLQVIPIPGEPATPITLNGLTDYNYCIYYTSAATITAGSFTVNYSA